MPYKCSKCGAEITAEFAAKTTDKFGEALCKSCVFDKNTGETKDEVEGAPSAPDEEPEQQTYSNGGKDNDVPVVKQPESKDKKISVVSMIRSFVGDDVLQVFGPTGSGKSKFALECARQALADGLKVFYLDTERNLTDADIASLTGCTYKYTPVLEEIDKACQNIPNVDIVIIDSIGFPILTRYARLNMKQRGDALLKMIAIFGDLKIWAYKHNGLAIVTNQPESDFNKAPNHVIRPFGDKSQFACKEIWRTDIKNQSESVTNSKIAAFRSRSVGQKTIIANMKISDDGVSIMEASR